jgi:MFS family permease
MSEQGIAVAVPPSKSPPRGEVQEGAWLALSVLVLINLFNYIDRQIMAAMEPHIRNSFFLNEESITAVNAWALAAQVQSHQAVGAGPVPYLLGVAQAAATANTEFSSRWPKFWMGVLAMAFLVAFMLAAPVFGAMANRMRRWYLIAMGVLVWSLASGATGIATIFGLMLVTRCLVGIGEAAYGPVAPDMISDLYPVARRGQVLAWFYMAIPFGGAIGYAIGAYAFILTKNWATPFFIVVPPGILLGIWCFLLPEPQRGQADPAATRAHGQERWSDYLILAKTPSYVLNTLGMTAMVFAMGGLAWWAPAYFKEHQVPELFGLDPLFAFGVLTAVSGLVATLAGGIAGDLLRSRFSGSYFLVSGAAMVLAFPMLLVFTYTPFPLAWIPLTLFVFLLFFNTGPTNTILANVTHPLLRAPGFAINILIIHLFGDAVSPLLMGFIADRYEKPFGLEVAFRVVSVLVLVGGVLWLVGTKHLGRDTELAPHRLPERPPAPTA